MQEDEWIRMDDIERVNGFDTIKTTLEQRWRAIQSNDSKCGRVRIYGYGWSFFYHPGINDDEGYGK